MTYSVFEAIMFDVWFPILFMIFAASLAMIAEHYLPWFLWLSGNKVHPVANYAMGILGILLPYSFLCVFWQIIGASVPPWAMALAIWLITCSAGLTVLACYGIDAIHNANVRAREAEERDELHRDQLER